jgi:hypothetical protein
MRVVGGYERDAGSFRKLHQRLSDAALRVQPVLLNLQEVVPLPQYLLKLFGGRHGLIKTVLGEHGLRHAGHAGGEAHQARAVLGQQLLVDARLVIEALREGLGAEAHQVPIALIIFG